MVNVYPKQAMYTNCKKKNKGHILKKKYEIVLLA